MKWSSILHGLNVGLEIAGKAAPVVSAFNPSAGLALGGILQTVGTVEAAIPTAKPEVKKSAAMARIEDQLLPMLNAQLAADGKKLVLTPALLEKFSGATDHLVAASQTIAGILDQVESIL